jgi:trimeric autotransporter adhesin
MGSIVTRGGLPALSLTITDPDGEAVNTIELWGAAIGAPVPSSPIKTYPGVASFAFSSGDAENIQPNGSSWYYFVIITQADGNKIVSSPVWYTRSDLALPVTLINFSGSWSADKAEAILTWSTAREINSQKFIIQRSTDNGTTWDDIGTIHAAGSSNFNQHYSFTDQQPKSSNWYRLKMVDIDNDYTYSKMVVLTTSTANSILYTIYPNPVTDFINIGSSSLQPQSVKIQLIDNTGRMISHQQLITSKSNPAIMPVQGYKAGLYYIIINDGQRSVKQKIVIADR